MKRFNQTTRPLGIAAPVSESDGPLFEGRNISSWLLEFEQTFQTCYLEKESFDRAAKVVNILREAAQADRFALDALVDRALQFPVPMLVTGELVHDMDASSDLNQWMEWLDLTCCGTDGFRNPNSASPAEPSRWNDLTDEQMGLIYAWLIAEARRWQWHTPPLLDNSYVDLFKDIRTRQVGTVVTAITSRTRSASDLSTIIGQLATSEDRELEYTATWAAVHHLLGAEQLAPLLASQYVEVQRSATCALALMGKTNEDNSDLITKTLEDMLSDSDGGVRWMALECVSYLPISFPAGLRDALSKSLARAVADQRLTTCVFNVNAADSRSLKGPFRVSTDEARARKVDVRDPGQVLAFLLARCGADTALIELLRAVPPNRAETPELQKVGAELFKFRVAAATALGRHRRGLRSAWDGPATAEVAKALAEALDDPSLRSAALESLRACGPVADVALPALRQLRDDKKTASKDRIKCELAISAIEQ